MSPDPKILLDQFAGRITAGQVIAVDPDDAEAMAAFEDDALDPETALDSRFDDEAEGDSAPAEGE